jgi:hypothetical protein
MGAQTLKIDENKVFHPNFDYSTSWTDTARSSPCPTRRPSGRLTAPLHRHRPPSSSVPWARRSRASSWSRWCSSAMRWLALSQWAPAGWRCRTRACELHSSGLRNKVILRWIFRLGQKKIFHFSIALVGRCWHSAATIKVKTGDEFCCVTGWRVPFLQIITVIIHLCWITPFLLRTPGQKRTA